MSTADARTQFAEVVNRTAFGKERLVLTRRGKALAAIVPYEDLELLEALEDARDSALIHARRIEWEAEGRPVTTLAEYSRKRDLDTPGQ